MQRYFKVTLGYGLNFIDLYPIDKAVSKVSGKGLYFARRKHGKDGKTRTDTDE